MKRWLRSTLARVLLVFSTVALASRCYFFMARSQISWTGEALRVHDTFEGIEWDTHLTEKPNRPKIQHRFVQPNNYKDAKSNNNNTKVTTTEFPARLSPNARCRSPQGTYIVKEDNILMEQEPGDYICPETPPCLFGALSGIHKEITVEQLIMLHPEMKQGRLDPTECLARVKLAVIIPYRNRYPHLHILLRNLIPFLKRQQADVTFFVIEQALPSAFNRGMMMNVGFLEAEKHADFDCYIFHEVNLIPLDDRNLYRCSNNPRRFAVTLKYSKRIQALGAYFGDIVGFSKHQFFNINGFSNLYPGSGGDDDDLELRIRQKNYDIVSYHPQITRYGMIRPAKDWRNEEADSYQRILLEEAAQRMEEEGLNTIKYKINSIEHRPLYIWINVSVSLTETLQAVPKSVSQMLMRSAKTMSRYPGFLEEKYFYKMFGGQEKV